MPSVENILALVEAPIFAPLVVAVLVVAILCVGRASRNAREQLRRANEIESRLRD